MSTILAKCNNLRGSMDVIRTFNSSKAWLEAFLIDFRSLFIIMIFYSFICFFIIFLSFFCVKLIQSILKKVNDRKNISDQNNIYHSNVSIGLEFYHGSFSFVRFHQVVQKRLFHWFQGDWLLLYHSYKILFDFFQLQSRPCILQLHLSHYCLIADFLANLVQFIQVIFV